MVSLMALPLAEIRRRSQYPVWVVITTWGRLKLAELVGLWSNVGVALAGRKEHLNVIIT